MGRGKRPESRRVALAVARPLLCHGRPLALVAESPAGRRLIESSPNRSHWDGGIPLTRWRCAVCGAEHDEGWLPPTWISAVASKAHEIRQELQAALVLAEAREGCQQALSGPQRAVEPSGRAGVASGAAKAALSAGGEG